MTFGTEPYTGNNDSNVWSWYLSNLKEGRFERIIENKKMLDAIRNENNSTSVKLIVHVYGQYEITDIKKVLAEKFEYYIPDMTIQDLNDTTATDDKLFLIEDTYNKFLYKFRIDSIKKSLFPIIKPSITQQPSPPATDKYSDIDMDMEPISAQVKQNLFQATQKYNNKETEKSYDTEDEDEDDGAIVLNFTRKSRDINLSRLEKEEYFSPVESEVISINSSFDNIYMSDNESNRINECPQLKRVVANNNSFILDEVPNFNKIDFQLAAVIYREENGIIALSTAIRQDYGEEWVVYNDFDLNNLEYCSMDEVLYGDREVSTLLFTTC